MTDKRKKKIEKTFIDVEFNENFYGYEIINPKAKNFYVTFGINSCVLKDNIKNKSDR